MAKDLKYNVVFSADTKQARYEIHALMDELQKIGNQSYVNKGVGAEFTKGFQEARKEVAQLQVALEKAFSFDTGKLDFVKFNQELKKSGKNLTDFSKTLVSLGPEGQQAFLNLANAISMSEIPIIKMEGHVKALANTLKNTLRWQISSSVLHSLMGAVQGAYRYAQDLNESLNNIRIVTGQSAEQMANFAEEANKAAQALGTSTTAYTDAALIYYQQGIRDRKEIEERTNATIKLANVTRGTAEEVSSQMTAIWNNFADGSKELEYYADAITALGANTASSSAEIAQGLEKFAAVSNTVGLSYEYATAALATVVAQTRLSAETVGTSFKTLFARLESLKLGETLEDGTDLNKYSKALDSVGVSIKDTNGDLRDMDDVLDDLGARWDSLGKDTKIALAQTIGGVRQYTQLIALMDNYDFFKENVNIASNSAGTLQKQQAIYAESWEAASKRVKAAWESIYTDIINDDFFIKITDDLAKFLKQIDEILDRMGGIRGLLLQIAPLVGQLYNKEIANFMTNAFTSASLMFGGVKRYEDQRSQYIMQGLASAKPMLGGNTAAYAKYESSMRYQQALNDYGDQLSDFDKAYLKILNEQNMARAEELQTLEKEIKALKERNKEADKDINFGPQTGGATKTKLIELTNRMAISQGALNPFTNTNLSNDVQVELFRQYMLENKDIISSTFKEGGFGKVHFNELMKKTEEYFTAPTEEDKEIIRNKIEESLQSFIASVFPDNTTSYGGKEIQARVNLMLESAFSPQLSKAAAYREKAIYQLAYEAGTTSKHSKETDQQYLDRIQEDAQLKIENLKEQRELATNRWKNATDPTEEAKEYATIQAIDKKLDPLTKAHEAYISATEKEKTLMDQLAEAKEKTAYEVKNMAVNRAKDVGQEKILEAEKQARLKEEEENNRLIEEEARRRAASALESTDIATRITAISTAMSSLLAISNSLANVWNTLWDENASLMDKSKAVIQGLVTAMMQFGIMTRGNTLAIVKNTFVQEVDTAATVQNTQAKKDNAIATAEESGAKQGNAVANAADAASENLNTSATKAKNLRLWKGGPILATGAAGKGLGSAALTGAGVIGGVAAAIVAAIVTTVISINILEDKIAKANKKLEEQNEKIKEWRQENAAALEAVDNYEIYNNQLKNNIITQDEYNEKLAETARQMKVNNAEILAQANAFGVLEKEVEKTANKLNEENLNKALQSDLNIRNLSAAGDKDLMQSYLYNPIITALTGGLSYAGSNIYERLSGDQADFTSTTKRIGSGGSYEATEAKLISDLRDLNIKGVNTNNGTISWDIQSMDTGDLAKLYKFFGDVQANSNIYGGEDNELIKNLNKMNENFAELAETLNESNDIQKEALLRQNIEEGVWDKAIGAGAIGYSALLDKASDTYGEEVIKKVFSGYFSEEDIQKATTMRSFADIYGFDATELLRNLEKSGVETDKVLNAIGKAPDLMAAGLKSVGNDFSKLTDHMQMCIDQIDLSNLDNMGAALEAVGSIKIGDIIKEKDYQNLKNLYDGIDNFVEVLNDGNAIALASGEEISEQIVRDSVDSALKIQKDPNYGALIKKELDDLNNQMGGSTKEANDKSKAIQDDIDRRQKRLEALQAALDWRGGDKLNTRLTTYLKDQDLGNIFSEEEERYFGVPGDTFTDKTGNKYNTNDYLLEQIKLEQQHIDNSQKSKDLITGQIEAYDILTNKYKEILELQENPFALEDKLVSQYTTMEELQNYYEQGLISAEKYENSVKRVAIQTAKALKIDVDILKTQADYLKENNIYVKDNETMAYALALAYEKQNLALDDLANNYESYNKALTENKVGSEEYTSAMSSLQKDMQNLFNTDADISEDFILKHLEDIGKAAEDDQKAIKKLQASYAIEASDIVDENTIAEIQATLNAISWDDLEIGVGVDTNDAIRELWRLTNIGIKDASKLQEFWNGLGFELKPKWETYTEPGVPPTLPNGQPNQVSYSKIVGWEAPHYTGTAHANKTKASTKSGSKAKEKDEEKERYYVINNQIEDQTKLLDRLSKAKDRAFGQAKLDLMSKESSELEKQIKLQKKKLEEAEKYYSFDQANLNAFGAKYGENGELINYDEIWNKEYKRYKKTGDDTRWEDFKKKLKQYEDTRDLIRDLQDDIRDLEYQLFDKKLEKIQYKVQVKVEVDDDELKLLEYQLSRIQKMTFSTAAQVVNYASQIDQNLDKQAIVNQGIIDILKNHNITLDKWAKMTDEEKGAAGFTEEEIKQLRDYNNQLIDLQKTIDDLEDKILSGPLEAFKEWNSELERQEKIIQHNTDLLNAYKDIADLIYSNGNITKKLGLEIMQNTLVNMTKSVDASRKELAINKQALDQARQAYEQALNDPSISKEEQERLKKNLEEMQQIVMQSETDLLTQVKAALDQAQKVFEEKIDQAKDKLLELTRATDWDFTLFDQMKAIDDEYLDDYEKIYHLSKLTRDVNNSISMVDSVRWAERLKEITQEIEEIEESGRQVSQYEVDALRKKYELRLAEIALEDAQAAKSQVRMSRDNEGNWSYVQTADKNKVDQAFQNYEDRLYEYQKLNSDFIKNTEETLMKLQKEYADAATEIWKDNTLTEAEKKERIKQLGDYYYQRTKIVSSQLDKGYANNRGLYFDDWTDYSKTTGYKISAEEDYLNWFETGYLGRLNDDIKSGADYYNRFKDVIDNTFGPATQQAQLDWAQNQKDILDAAGMDIDNYGNLVSDSMAQIAVVSDTANQAVSTAATGMVNSLAACYSAIQDLDNLGLNGLRTSLAQTSKDVKNLISDFSDLSKAASVANQIPTPTDAKNSIKNGSGDGSGGGGSDETWALNTTGQKINELAEALAYEAQMNEYSGGQIQANAKNRKTLENELASWKLYKEKDLMLKYLVMKIKNKQDLKKYYKNFGITNTNGYWHAASLDTGGYTGSWGNAGRLAVLHEKELVLNKDDTKNMLNMVQIARDVVDSAALSASQSNIRTPYNNYKGNSLEQNVHIEASFPNVTNHLEIEQAFNNLVNAAAQYANRK